MSEVTRPESQTSRMCVPPHHLGKCFVAPHPRLLEDLKSHPAEPAAGGMLANALDTLRDRRRTGRNDGMIRPPADAAPGMSREMAIKFAMQRVPLRGNLNIIVVLVEFPDKKFQAKKERFSDLFFSSGKIETGSVQEYYAEVSHAAVNITGEVVGPYLMAKPISYYADGSQGKNPVVRELAYDALIAADPDVNFKLYDNDGDGYVDAFIVVHAGQGAEQTNQPNDLWSHKWTLPGDKAYSTDGTNVFGYLTVPEDAKLGVCAHELGHLLFAWPDLYDTDYTSMGIGDFCLMSGGSWGGDGNVPCHPCAWCKSGQGWIAVENETREGEVEIEDVKSSRKALRLWTRGAPGSEYFLLENRQMTGYDRSLPGGGLFIWHIDESQTGNEDEEHYEVALLQADGLRQLEKGTSRGDENDMFPGGTGNTRCDDASNPSTAAYSKAPSRVAIFDISPSGPTMTASISVDATAAIASADIRDTGDA